MNEIGRQARTAKPAHHHGMPVLQSLQSIPRIGNALVDHVSLNRLLNGRIVRERAVKINIA